MDLKTGKKQRLLPDLMMENYSISPDEKQVVFINDAKPGKDAVDREHGWEHARAPVGQSGMQSRAVRAGWRNLFRRRRGATARTCRKSTATAPDCSV